MEKPIPLTSRLTIFYKLILPGFFGFVMLLMWAAAIALMDSPDGKGMLVVAIVVTGFMVLISPPMFVQKASYDKEFLYVNNFRRTKKIPVQRIKKLHRWLFYFYRIDYLDEANRIKKVYILPSIIERFEAMMGMPASLEVFEEEIIKKNT